jgi:phage recombination protein Bet
MTAVTPYKEAATGMSRAQVELIKDTIARDQSLTDDECRLFLYAAERHGLDPLAKQIYAVRRQGKLTIQAGIDGLRLVAARTGEYGGTDEPGFEDAGGTYPHKATVTLYRFVQGQRCAFVGFAYWSEFYPGDGAVGTMWRKMPHTMLAKCAEANALRKAFPAELSGLYTTDEMAQAAKPAPKNGKKPLHERSDKELAKLRDWAERQQKPDLVSNIADEMEKRRTTAELEPGDAAEPDA